MEPTTEPIEPRCTGESGAAIVESAMLLPILILFLAGVFDFGVGYRNRVTIQNSLRSAARVAAASQASGNADQLTLSTIAAGLGDVKNIKVNRVVIYETNADNASSGTSASVPGPCGTTSTDGTTAAPTGTGAGSQATTSRYCNVYSSWQVFNAATATGFTAAGATSCSSNRWDRFWCPTTRLYSLTQTGSGGLGPDYLGIFISVDYTTYTGLIKKTLTLNDHVVVRLEPPAGG